jgi:hypothetical protein
MMSPDTGQRRFVVLCLARTGSSNLVSLLDSHPEIRCYGEILNMTHPKAAPEAWLGDADTDDPIAHARAVLATPGATATGFKLPLNSLRNHPAAADWVASEPGLRVIRLLRGNTLALLLSRRLLQATLVSQSTDGSYGDATVEIDPAGCIRALERIEREDAELDRLAAGQPSFRLLYEQLGAGAELAPLQEFLGVEQAELRSPYRRLRQRGFEHTISNWEQLSSALLKTRFAPLVDENPTQSR